MGEHGLFGHPPFYLYEPLLRIPLIIKLSKDVKIKNSFINNTVKWLDICSTIYDVLGLKYKHNLDGESLLPLIIGSKNLYKCKDFISEITTTHLAVRSGKWKFIYRIKDGEKVLELFDINNDLREET